MDDIIELHRALQEARGLDTTTTTTERYKIHTANVKDIRALSAGNDGYCCNQDQGNGWDSTKIAQLLNLPIDMVETERDPIARYNQRRRKFLATGDLDLPQPYGTPTVYTIFQR